MKWVVLFTFEVIRTDDLIISRIVGFEEFEGGDNFTTSALELTMIQCGKFLLDSLPPFFVLILHISDVIDPNPQASLALLKAVQSTSRGNGPKRGIRSRQIGSDEDSD